MKRITLFISLVTICFNSFALQHWIIFLAYPHRKNVPGYEDSKAGHAYVSFVTRDETNKQTVVDEIWGFHPLTQSWKAIFTEEKGEMKSKTGIYKGKPQSESILAAEYDFVIEIKDEIIYQNCRKVKDLWNRADYSVIAGQTCVDYAKDVAARIGNLIIPNTNSDSWPKDFLINLKQQNENIDKKGRETLSKIPLENDIQPKDDLSVEGTKLLFLKTKSKLSAIDKLEIYGQLGFALTADHKRFYFKEKGDQGKQFYFIPIVDITDMNKDGIEEIFVHWGVFLTPTRSGNQVNQCATLFIKRNGIWEKNLNELGLASLTDKYNLGYPNLISGNYSNSISSLWQWNGSKYILLEEFPTYGTGSKRMTIIHLPNIGATLE